MLYYAHKSNLHLHKSKCELAQVYQKANDNNYTSPALEQKICSRSAVWNIVTKVDENQNFQENTFPYFLGSLDSCPLETDPPHHREKVQNDVQSMLLMMRTLDIFLLGKKKDRKKTDGPKKKKTRTTFTAYQVFSNYLSDPRLMYYKRKCLNILAKTKFP